MIGSALLALAAALSTAAAANEPLTARAVIERGIAAHGGELFRNPSSLKLSGTATFYDAQTGKAGSTADDYRMWRTFDEARTSAHGASGKVRITARAGERTLFDIGYDGKTTWTERGIMPKAKADAYWASNFGFGIVRRALDEGFTLSLAPPRNIGGRETHIVRITDPQGAHTLFGFDVESGFITYMAFDAPRGFHERLYGDFIRLDNGWVQARSVTLLYGGVMSNTVFWSSAAVGEAVEDSRFQPPAGMGMAD
ncbi:MAG: hypothetical protein QNI87_03865 [Erythrobacter sp.]|uniref:hypothetical protein n=1 Tax=Erythrobacter sp. TaxID=1042 RepID=UPI0026115FAA|nr:hypothetical protein [Erythrobacter sp.]MDJ0977650.1 hypothetical protein [Erythrobacter sp.]